MGGALYRLPFVCHPSELENHEKHQICCESEPWRAFAPAYVHNGKLALMMGRFRADDAALQTSQSIAS
jgi:hypothetical protein